MKDTPTVVSTWRLRRSAVSSSGATVAGTLIVPLRRPESSRSFASWSVRCVRVWLRGATTVTSVPSACARPSATYSTN